MAVKNSVLCGAAESAPVQSTSNAPSGSVKQAKGYTGPLSAVTHTATNRKPTPVDIAGESNKTYVKELKKTELAGNH